MENGPFIDDLLMKKWIGLREHLQDTLKKGHGTHPGFVLVYPWRLLAAVKFTLGEAANLDHPLGENDER